MLVIFLLLSRRKFKRGRKTIPFFQTLLLYGQCTHHEASGTHDIIKVFKFRGKSFCHELSNKIPFFPKINESYVVFVIVPCYVIGV